MIITKNGLEKRLSTGYSWKCLLFGVFYAASRGDYKGFIIQSVLAIVTGGLSWLVVPFTYNKRYLERMVSDGWEIKK